MAERQHVVLDPAVASILTPEDAGKMPAVRRRATPHEQGRVARRMSVTFPDASWPDAVRNLAHTWRVRPADVLVLAVARLMADLEAGEDVGDPMGIVGFQERAGESFALPWEP